MGQETFYTVLVPWDGKLSTQYWYTGSGNFPHCPGTMGRETIHTVLVQWVGKINNYKIFLTGTDMSERFHSFLHWRTMRSEFWTRHNYKIPRITLVCLFPGTCQPDLCPSLCKQKYTKEISRSEVSSPFFCEVWATSLSNMDLAALGKKHYYCT